MRRMVPVLAIALGCGTSPSPNGPRAATTDGYEDVTPVTPVAVGPPSADEGALGTGAPGSSPNPSSSTSALPLPSFEPFRRLAPEACLARLRELDVPHRERAHEAVEAGVIVEEVGDVTWEFEGRLEVHRVMDCRLVLALHAWAPTLRAAGVTKVRHLSALRPSARVRSTGAVSGHARGLAVDPRHFELADGTQLDVLEDWTWRERGAEPCATVDEPTSSAMLRGMICRAIEAGLFQVVVTPHHDDLHANHVHVEVVPDAEWSWAR
jgi:hypothetical protein